jgi:hypothetical protein
MLPDVVTKSFEVLRIRRIAWFLGLERQVVKWQRMDVSVET